MEVHVHLKNAFPGGIGNRWITFGYNLWFASHPSRRHTSKHLLIAQARNWALPFFALRLGIGSGISFGTTFSNTKILLMMRLPLIK